MIINCSTKSAREEDKSKPLSVQAKRFLKDNYQFTEQVKKFEDQIENPTDLKDSSILLKSITSLDFPGSRAELEEEIGNETYYGEYDFRDEVTTSISNVDYFISKEGKLSISADVQKIYSVTFQGPAHDYDYYEPPVYDERTAQVTENYKVYATIDVNSDWFLADEEITLDSTEVDI